MYLTKLYSFLLLQNSAANIRGFFEYANRRRIFFGKSAAPYGVRQGFENGLQSSRGCPKVNCIFFWRKKLFLQTIIPTFVTPLTVLLRVLPNLLVMGGTEAPFLFSRNRLKFAKGYIKT
jgi:hypothetical protein